MTQESKQRFRLWIYRSLAVLLIVVFFTVRALTRDRVEIHVAMAARIPLISTISTNGRVEPLVNYEIHSPVATTVKEVYVQPGDQVAAGKLLMTLDELQARASEASAESGVKAAQAALEAATHNGSQQERQMAAADVSRAQLERDEARRSLDALTKLHATGASSAYEVAAARQRLDAAEANLHAVEQSATSRYSPAEVERARASLADAEASLASAQAVVAQTVIHAPIAGTVYSINASRTDFVSPGSPVSSHQRSTSAFISSGQSANMAMGIGAGARKQAARRIAFSIGPRRSMERK